MASDIKILRKPKRMHIPSSMFKDHYTFLTFGNPVQWEDMKEELDSIKKNELGYRITQWKKSHWM